MPEATLAAVLKVKADDGLYGEFFEKLKAYIDGKAQGPTREPVTRQILVRIAKALEQVEDGNEELKVALQFIQHLHHGDGGKAKSLRAGVNQLLEKVLGVLSRTPVLQSGPRKEILYDYYDTIMMAASTADEKGKDLWRKSTIPALLLFACDEHHCAPALVEGMKVVNSLLQSCLVESLRDLGSIATVKNSLMTMGKRLSILGDMELQMGFVEAIFRLTSIDERKRLATHCFHYQSIVKCFVGINDAEFEPDCRKFLNSLNGSNANAKRVVSLPCSSAFVGDVQLQRPKDTGICDFWVDFNPRSSSMTVFIQDTALDHDMWDTIAVNKDRVLSYHVSVSNSQGHQLTIQLSQALAHISSSQQVKIFFSKEYDPRSALQATFGQKLEKVPVKPRKMNRMSIAIASLLISGGKTTISESPVNSAPNSQLSPEKQASPDVDRSNSCATPNLNAATAQTPKTSTPRSPSSQCAPQSNLPAIAPVAESQSYPIAEACQEEDESPIVSSAPVALPIRSISQHSEVSQPSECALTTARPSEPPSDVPSAITGSNMEILEHPLSVSDRPPTGQDESATKKKAKQKQQPRRQKPGNKNTTSAGTATSKARPAEQKNLCFQDHAASITQSPFGFPQDDQPATYAKRSSGRMESRRALQAKKSAKQRLKKKDAKQREHRKPSSAPIDCRLDFGSSGQAYESPSSKLPTRTKGKIESMARSMSFEEVSATPLDFVSESDVEGEIAMEPSTEAYESPSSKPPTRTKRKIESAARSMSFEEVSATPLDFVSERDVGGEIAMESSIPVQSKPSANVTPEPGASPAHLPSLLGNSPELAETAGSQSQTSNIPVGTVGRSHRPAPCPIEVAQSPSFGTSTTTNSGATRALQLSANRILQDFSSSMLNLTDGEPDSSRVAKTKLLTDANAGAVKVSKSHRGRKTRLVCASPELPPNPMDDINPEVLFPATPGQSDPSWSPTRESVSDQNNTSDGVSSNDDCQSSAKHPPRARKSSFKKASDSGVGISPGANYPSTLQGKLHSDRRRATITPQLGFEISKTRGCGTKRAWATTEHDMDDRSGERLRKRPRRESKLAGVVTEDSPQLSTMSSWKDFNPVSKVNYAECSASDHLEDTSSSIFQPYMPPVLGNDIESLVHSFGASVSQNFKAKQDVMAKFSKSMAKYSAELVDQMWAETIQRRREAVLDFHHMLSPQLTALEDDIMKQQRVQEKTLILLKEYISAQETAGQGQRERIQQIKKGVSTFSEKMTSLAGSRDRDKVVLQEMLEERGQRECRRLQIHIRKMQLDQMRKSLQATILQVK